MSGYQEGCALHNLSEKRGRLKSLLPFFVLCLILGLAAQVGATTIYANGDPNCTFDGDGLSPGCAASAGGSGARTTVQAAIDQAAGGDVVKVVPYNYGTPSRYSIYYENLTISKEITLEADTSTLPASGPPTAYWTAIDGDETNDGVGDNGNATISWSGGVGGTLRNLRIEGGYSELSDGNGAGIMIAGEGTDLVVSGLMVRYNETGISIRYGAAPTITGCIIYFNDKAGISVRDGSAPTIGGGDCNGNPQTCKGDSNTNRIYRNSRRMTTAQCFSGGSFDNCQAKREDGCAAIAVLDSSRPKIWGNKVYSNNFSGIAALGQAAPSVKWNLIRGNGLTGLGLLSAGQGIEVVGNWFEKNQRGIGVQSSGDPCDRIVIKDNDILRNTLDGIVSCKSYMTIGGTAADGNRIYDNEVNGLYLIFGGESEVSYNNIINNHKIGVELYNSAAVIEKNLIADNGVGQATLQYGQVAVFAGTAKRINNNLIIGSRYNQISSSFEGSGILVQDSPSFPGVPGVIQDVRDNIIYRVGTGIKLSGADTLNAYQKGAVDRNLVMDWDNVLNASAYDLGSGNKAAEQTYYYGQESGSYGAGPDYFFSDPNHLTDTVAGSCSANVNAKCPDYKIAYDSNSPLYTISGYAGPPAPADYLGLPSDFVYIDQENSHPYDFAYAVSGLLPSLDQTDPALDRMVPPDGSVGASRDQKVMAYLKDTGDGVDADSVELSISGVGGCSPATTPCTVSGDSSYLRVEYRPGSQLAASTLYTISVLANDLRANQLSVTTGFTTNVTETTPPALADLSPANGASSVAGDTAIRFKLRDTESGINPDSIGLKVNNVSVSVVKTPLTDGSGAAPDYSVYYKPGSAFGAGNTVTLNIRGQDFDSNLYSEAKSFTITPNTAAPPDITKLQAQVQGASSVRLSWIPSSNIDCDIASYPYTLYIDNGNGYDSGQALSLLFYNEASYIVANLTTGTYAFKITVKDVLGVESAGTEVANVRLATSSKFEDDFEGFTDLFDSDLGKWSASGTAGWALNAGKLQASGADGELIVNNFNRSDYRLLSTVTITSAGADDAAWYLLRKTSGAAVGSSGYAVKIGLGSTNNVGIYKLTGAGTTLLESADYTISSGVAYLVNIEIENNAVRLTLDSSPSPIFTAIDTGNSYWDGAIGLWQPVGSTAAVSYDDFRVDYNKTNGGIFRYSASENSWVHTTSSGGTYKDLLYTGGSASARELLVDPLSLTDDFYFKAKINIAGGSAGLLVRKTAESAVGSSGYLVQLDQGSSGNVKFYALPGSLLATGNFTINTDTDYWVWLVGRGNSYQVSLSNSALYSERSQVINTSSSDFAANNLAGLYGFASSQVKYDDLYISDDMQAIGGSSMVYSNMSYSTIQSYIDNANPGDTIIFSGGVYDIGAETLIMRDGVSLKAKDVGACRAKTVTLKSSDTIIKAAGSASIEGFKLVGDGTNVGIWVIDVSPEIVNNEIVSCYDGVRVGGGASSATVLSSPNINNNCVYKNSHLGIGNSVESTAVIEVNQIFSNSNHGIGVQQLAAPQIRGNAIYGNTGAGIANRGQSYATISQSNKIYSNVKQGVAVRDHAATRIENNETYKNLMDGIGVGCEQSDPLCVSDAQPVISNNTIYSNLESGIAMRTDVRPTISGNEIYNHIFTTCPSCNDGQGPDHSFGAGIRMLENARPILGQNDLHDNSYGMSMNLSSSNLFTISGLSITRNGIGLHVGGDSAITIENCTLYSNYKLGLGLYHTAHPLIRNNEIRHNGDAAGRAGDYLKYMTAAGTGAGGIGLSEESYPTITGTNRIWGHAAEISIADDALGTQNDIEGQFGPTTDPLPSNMVRLGSSAVTTDDYYKGRSVYLFSADGDPAYNGAGTPQIVNITAYDGTTKIATVSPAYAAKPVQNERYRVFRENYAIGLRGCKRNDGSPCSESGDAPDVPKIYGNLIYDNYIGIAVGGRDSVTGAPNPEIYNNTITSNGCPSGCPTDFVFCGGGIGNRAASTANIHDNTIRHNDAMNNYGIGIRESAAPVIADNQIISNRLGIGFYYSSGITSVTGNSIIDNGIFTSSRMRAGGVGLFWFAGTVTLDNNTIASNNGSGPAAGGIGIRQIDGGTVNIGTTVGNTIRYNKGGKEAGELRCGGIGGRYDTTSGGTINIRKNNIYSNITGGIGLDDFEYASFKIYDSNQIHHNKKGIRIRNTANVLVSSNTIYSNGTGTKPDPATGTLADAGISIRKDPAHDPTPPLMTMTITSNTIKDNNGVGISVADLTLGDSVAIRANTIGGDSAADGNDLWGISIGVFDQSIFSATVTIGGDNAIDSNKIKYNKLSGISVEYVNDKVTIKNNDISYNGQDDFSGGAEDQDASGIRAKNSYFGTNKIIGNTISYNLYAGIAFNSTDGLINSGNDIFENGNLYAILGGNGDGCPNCQVAGTGSGPGSLTGDGGISVKNLALTKELRIYDPTRTEIYDNHAGDVRVNPNNQGKVYLNDIEVVSSGSGGMVAGFGMVFNCFDAADADPGGACNTTVTGYGYGAKTGVNNTLANQDRYGLLVRGQYSQNLVIEGNIIQSNMLVSNSNNVICSDDPPNKDNAGGGIALTCGARPTVRNNIIRYNGADLRPEGKGSHSGINLWKAGAAQIYNNEIYANANDGVGLIDSEINSAPQIGVLGQTANSIYGNGRFGVGLTGSGTVNIAYNNIYQNSSGGVGGYQFSGTANIYDNSIYSNTGSTLSEVAGIGLKNLSGTANISNNIIRNNVYTSSYDYPAGIGIYLPLGGSVAIDNNIIASNRAHSASNVGGIGLRGLSSSSYSAIGDVSITSNRINNHLYAAGGDQAGIAFEYLDFNGASMIIRNNDKDGIGISDNASGVRFRYIKNAATVTVSDNTINSNYCDWTTGGVGVEFRNCATLNVDVDNNIMSNNHFSGSGSSAGVIAFEYCQLYSGNYIKIRRNHINNTDANGMEFRYIGGYDNTHVAHLYIGTDAEAPGTSNDIINIAANRNAIRFEDNTYGDGIEMNILNNNNLEGGIAFRDSELTALNIIGNANIYDGGVPGGMSQKGSVCEGSMGSVDWDYNGIQGKVNTYGAVVVPVVIRNNGIRDNARLGIFLPIISETGKAAFTIENNTMENNGYTSFFSPSGFYNCMDSFIFSGNTVYNNGNSGDADPGYDSDGVVMRNLESSVAARFTNNIIYSNKVNGLSLRACDNVTVSGGEYHDNGIRGIGTRDFGSVVLEDGVKLYKNGKLTGAEDDWCGAGFNDTDVVVRNSFIYENKASGLKLVDAVSGTIENNQVYSNDRTGISLLRSNAIVIQNNTIVSNGSQDYVSPTGLPDASGIKIKDSAFGTVSGNTIRNNKFTGIAVNNTTGTIGPNNAIRYNGNNLICSSFAGGIGNGDGGIAVRDLGFSDTLIVSGNTIADNYVGTVSRRDSGGTVRLNGVVLPFEHGYWDKTQAKVYVEPNGVYVNGVFEQSSLVIDGAVNSKFTNINGGEVWGIAIVGGARDVIVRNCTIENNQVTSNSFGPGGTSLGGGILVGPGALNTQIYNNSIRYNGYSESTGSYKAITDGVTTSEWKPHPGDVHIEPDGDEPGDSHWFAFRFAADKTISKVRVFTGTDTHIWDIYFGNNKMWRPNFNYPTYEADKVVGTANSPKSGATVGPTPGWQEITFSAPRTNRTLWMCIYGSPVNDHVYEFEYYDDTLTTWVGSADGIGDDQLGACSSLKPGNAGIILRCANGATVRDNLIYSNKNNAIEIRESTATIGPNNEFYECGKRTTFGIWTVAVMDDVDVTIYSNDFHDNYMGIGMQMISGDVTISSNKFHSFTSNNGSRAIGRQTLIGAFNLDIRNNQFYSNSNIMAIEMEQTRGNHLNLNVDSNTQDSGLMFFKWRYDYNVNASVFNNNVSNMTRFGMQFQYLGETGTVTDVNITSNNFSDNKRTALRFREYTNVSTTIEDNTFAGNAWNPPNNNTQDSIHFKALNHSAVVINNNVITSSATHDVKYDGIAFKESEGTDVTITSNIIRNHLSGGIVFRDNIIGTAPGASANVVIRNNYITSNDLIGIEFKNNVLDWTTIFSNSISYNGIGSVSSDWGGVWFQNNDNVTIEKCYVSNNTGIGLRFQDSSNIFIGWSGWDPLNAVAGNAPFSGEPNCYPYPAGAPLYAQGSVPDCRYSSNARAYGGWSPCGTTYFDPTLSHTWLGSDLWDSATGLRAAGTGTTLLNGNTSWAIQIRADDKDVSNVEFRGAVVSGNSGPGFGFISDNGYTLNAKVNGSQVTGNTGGDGIQAKEVCTAGCGTTIVTVENSKVTGGDAVEARDGAHLNIRNGNLFTIKLRVWGGSSEVYNYNYIGCINDCSGGGGTGKAAATYNMHHYNCIGGHVPFDNDYMDVHDHNWFEGPDTFEMHEGGGGSFWNGNRFVGGNIRKNQSGPFTMGDGNATEPNYFPNGVNINPIDGSGGNSVSGNFCGAGGCWVGNADGRPLPSETCNYGSGGGGTPCSGNLDWAGSCGDPDPACSYWTGPNAWESFCVDRNCTAPDASPYW